MTTTPHPDSFQSLRPLSIGGKPHARFAGEVVEAQAHDGPRRLPYALRALLENVLRGDDGSAEARGDVEALAGWRGHAVPKREIGFRPARVLLQDFTGVPALADLAAMRDAAAERGGDASAINPLIPVDLVIDHSVMVDWSASADAKERNLAREYERNGERYAFLRWGAQALKNVRVIPPGAGICHQVNLERLAEVARVMPREGEAPWVFPDTLVGADSHTTMVNALGVLGWGVGGIEAEAAMLGQPAPMLAPEVVGVRLVGAATAGATATDITLMITQTLRAEGVVGKFVEFHGAGLDALGLEDRATIANMAPEYGATCGFFPVDARTMDYLRVTGRPQALLARVEAYTRAEGLWRDDAHPAEYSHELEIDLTRARASLAGPRRPQDRVTLDVAKADFETHLAEDFAVPEGARDSRVPMRNGHGESLGHGDVVIAAITSCTNTSNPSAMVGAGLLARAARAKGLRVQPWVKTSLAPGSRAVSRYLDDARLTDDLDALGFQVVGYGCTTCIGNAGPLPEAIVEASREHNLVSVAVLSGNRNFESRIHADVRANYLASPMLVVAYALAGTMRRDLIHEPLGQDTEGADVFLRDVWPDPDAIQEVVREVVRPEAFHEAAAFVGDDHWRGLDAGDAQTRYDWNPTSTYVRRPPFLTMAATPRPTNARILALLGDSITTDHISPAGAIPADAPAGRMLLEEGVSVVEFNSFGARRGNHDIMARGTFANTRLNNAMGGGKLGGWTTHHPSGRVMTMFDAATAYEKESVPLVVFAGSEYGTGSSRDWGAKGPRLLGVSAVVAISFERIHRSNLIGMGILPLECDAKDDWRALALDGSEVVSVEGLSATITPRQTAKVAIKSQDGSTRTIEVRCRIDTPTEAAYYAAGGVLPFVLNKIAPSD